MGSSQKPPAKIYAIDLSNRNFFLCNKNPLPQKVDVGFSWDIKSNVKVQHVEICRSKFGSQVDWTPVQQQVVEPKELQPWDVRDFRFQYIYGHPITFDFWSPSHSPLNFLAAGLNSRLAAEFCVEFESYTDVTICAFSLNHRSLTDIFPLNETSHKKKPREIRNCGFLNQSWRDSCGFMSRIRVPLSKWRSWIWSEAMFPVSSLA